MAQFVDPDDDRALLQRHFSHVIDRRDSLIAALTAFAHEAPAGRARNELRRLIEMLRRSTSVDDLSGDPLVLRWLPLLASPIWSAGNTDSLTGFLQRTAQQTDERNRQWRMLAYPLMVLMIALIVFVMLCTWVVPEFATMFDEFGLQVPAFTEGLIAVAGVIDHHPVAIAFAVIVAIAGGYGLLRLGSRYASNSAVLGFAFCGSSASVHAMASFTRQLAELLNLQFPLSDALWIAAQGCPQPRLKRTAETLARHVQRDHASLQSVPRAHEVPANLLYALQAGPDGGPNVSLLRELAAIYSDQVQQRISWMTGSVAPIGVLVVALTVGLIAVSLLLPLFSLISGLS